MKWVKTSERLPEKEARYFVKINGIPYILNNKEAYFNQDNIEWLDESTPAPETCSCGVPYKIHSSCCGWQNARPIIFGCETRVNPTMTPEETELRWLISQSPNADKIAEQLFTNKIAL